MSESKSPSNAVIDLSGVSVFSLEGIAALLPLRERLLKLGGCLKLYGANQCLLNKFTRMNLWDRIFKISNTIDEQDYMPFYVI